MTVSTEQNIEPKFVGHLASGKRIFVTASPEADDFELAELTLTERYEQVAAPGFPPRPVSGVPHIFPCGHRHTFFLCEARALVAADAARDLKKH